MKPIKITKKELKKGTLLTGENCENLLLRVGIDRYAVLDNETYHPIAAFESKEFSEINNSLDEEQIVRITTHGTPFDLDEGKDFQVRLHAIDGEIWQTFGVSMKNPPFVIQPLNLDSVHNFGTLAQDIYDVRSSKIGEHIILAPNMISRLEPIIRRKSATTVLKQMRKEAHKQRDLLSDSIAIGIQGKFCEFLSTELKCGRLMFLTEEDTLLEDSPFAFERLS